MGVIDTSGAAMERRLRSSVSVSEGDREFSLTFSMWRLDLPAEWVRSVGGMSGFLTCGTPLSQVQLDDRKAVDLVRLLDIQGCLTVQPKDLCLVKIPSAAETLAFCHGSSIMRRRGAALGAWIERLFGCILGQRQT